MERVSDYDGALLFTPQAGSNDFEMMYFIIPCDILCDLIVELFPQKYREKKYTLNKSEKNLDLKLKHPVKNNIKEKKFCKKLKK